MKSVTTLTVVALMLCLRIIGVASRETWPAGCGSDCEQQSEDALKALLIATGAIDAGANIPWSSSTDCTSTGGASMAPLCCWEAVQCCCSEGEDCEGCAFTHSVQRLAIKDSSLSGPLAALMPALEVLNAWGLEELSLEGNQLTGTIPPAMGNLTSLTRLSLGSNRELGLGLVALRCGFSAKQVAFKCMAFHV